MDLISVVGAVLRRWYVLVPILALGAGGAYYVATTAGADYQVAGTYLLTTDPLAGDVDESEPTEADIEGVSDAPLLSAVLGLDRRQFGEGTVDGPVFTTSVLGQETLQVDAWADDADGVTQLLDELVGQAEEALTPGLALNIVARTEPAPAAADDERGGLEGGLLMRITGGETVGEGGAALSTGYVGRVLSEMMLSGSARSEVLSGGPQGTYSVATQDRDQAPILVVQGVGRSPGDALGIYERAVAVATERLEQIHDAQNVVENQRLVLDPLVEPTGAEVIEDRGRRPALTILGLTVLIAAGVSLAVDSVLQVRRARRRTKSSNLGSGPGSDLEPRQSFDLADLDEFDDPVAPGDRGRR